ncbi:MAG TPA: NADH-quinone oxidoreductase subunit L [Candidatus Krumholzibacteria bacterium]|nr:NADH-quinone oxidoreductase subunit L [Candidatus Krumholzibacteria bacterium]
MEATWLWLIPIAPLVTSVLCGAIALATRNAEAPPRRLVGWLACLGPGLSFALSLLAWTELRGLMPVGRMLSQTAYRWIDSGVLQLDVGFVVDPLSSLMLLFVTGVGTLIHIYSTGYMHAERGFARYFAYLNLFMFSMLILVLADSLPLLFVGWEGVGLCSYLLIGYWFEDPAKAAAGKKAFVVNRIGDFGVLIAMFLVLWTLQGVGSASLSFADLRRHTEAFTPALATAVCLLLFLGATGKSAQIPLYVWLPDAMAGPTPVSALIHAATMVTAGVYLVARMHFLFALSPVASTIVAVVGAATALLAATIAVAQNDFKKVLAYSTVSQLGYMFVGVGVGAYGAGIFHVFTHAFFKACLFLGSGAVIHALHDEQDIRRMGGLRHKMPLTFWTFVIATLALAGIPPLAGFFSKDHILWEALSKPNVVAPWLPPVLWVVLVAAALCTAFYMWRLVALVFLGSFRGDAHTYEHAHEAPPSMAMPLVLLATGSVLVGLLGVPHLLGGSNRLESWLHPSFTLAQDTHLESPPHEGEESGGSAAETEASVGHEPVSAHATSAALPESAAMAVALAAGLLGLGLGHQLYVRRPQAASALAMRLPAVRRLLAGKYFIDELYAAAIVRPLRLFSDRVLWRIVDMRLIDGSVRLLGWLTWALSVAFRFAQSGYVQTYVLVVVLGVFALLWRVL